MLSNPELVVLDELTNAFEACGRRETCALMRRLRADGLSVCLSHTISTRPSAGATRPPVLRPGRLLAIGYPEEIAEGGRLQDANRRADRRGGGDMTPGRSRALWRTTLVELRLYLREPAAAFFSLLLPADLLVLNGSLGERPAARPGRRRRRGRTRARITSRSSSPRAA
jgi:hypothetical protein